MSKSTGRGGKGDRTYRQHQVGNKDHLPVANSWFQLVKMFCKTKSKFSVSSPGQKFCELLAGDC
jgi:hypothetical protein